MPVAGRARPVPPGRRAPQLEMRDLRLVTAVAQEGTLTRAGQRLNVTQPALSRHLRQLEERLGGPLFARAGTRMRPTGTGELLLRHAREMLDRIAATESELENLSRGPRRVARLASECYTAYHWLPLVLSRFSARHPEVDVEIAFEVRRRPVKPLLAGTLDLALVSGERKHAGIMTRRLFTDEFMAVVPPGHPWTERGHVEPEDFAGVRLLLVVPPAESSVVQRFLEPARVKPLHIADVQLIGALCALVEGQFGVGVVPGWIVEPEVKAGRVATVRLGRRGLKRVWLAAALKDTFREPWLPELVQTISAVAPGVRAPVS
jgi:LysR family transcriptional regulator for metE and metH